MDEPDHSSASSESLMLGKAAVNAGNRLGLPDPVLAELLAIDESRLRELRQGQGVLKPQTEEWRHALMLVRVYEGLLSVVGNDCEAQRWLNSENLALEARPVDLLTQQGGLDDLLQYLDAVRTVS